MAWTPSLKQIDIIALTARMGNLTRVAAALNVTQPAVSHALREMERQLGYALFTRDRSLGLRPTAETLLFLPHAERVRAQVTELAAAMRGLGAPVRQELRIATLNSISATLIPRALQAFRAAHGAVQVTALVASGAEIGDMMQHQEIDCAVVYGSPHEPPQNGVALLETEVACFSAPGPRGGSRRLKTAALGAGAIILPTRDTVMGDIIRHGIAAHDGPMIEVNSAFSAIGLVREGLGSALVDPLLISHAHTRGLRVRRLDPSIGLRIDLLFGRLQRDRGAVQDFLPFLRDAAEQVGQRLQKASIHARLC